MVFGLCAKVLEDRLLPVPLHVIPVVYHTMTDRVVHAVPRRPLVCNGFITDEEIQVLYTTL